MAEMTEIAGEGCAGERVEILFTHDLHSHMDTVYGENGEETGGFGKLCAAIQSLREKNPHVVVLDGGDFSMGTLYQTIYRERAAELCMLGYMGYDVVTLGNHEFDYRPEGIAAMLRAALRQAKELQIELPQMTLSNVDWEINTSAENEVVREGLEEYGARRYVILEKGGVRIAVIGLFGEDASACAPLSGLCFDHIVESARGLVRRLKAKEHPDLIVALSHSGTASRPEKSEDEILAREVPDIDVIISGHTHTTLPEPLMGRGNYIVSCGCYGECLGRLVLRRGEDGWQAEAYELIPMDGSIRGDEEMERRLLDYQKDVTELYLRRFGYESCRQVIARNPYRFPTPKEIESNPSESTLGDLISDAYVYGVKKAEGDRYEKVSLTLVASGLIRETLKPGDVTVADVFGISSLGIGEDQVPGYPLVSAYLTGRELKAAAEVDASVAWKMASARLHPAGMYWEFNPHRIFLNRVTEVGLLDEEGGREPLEDGQLYRVVTGLYLAQMLGAVREGSHGLLAVVPKDREGRPITDFAPHIIHNPDGSEVKEWAALAGYLSSFPPKDGIPVVPPYYSRLHGRKKVRESRNIRELVRKPNKIFWAAAGAVCAASALCAVLAIGGMKLAVRHARMRKERK